jgi:membrane protease YdiL (CAAX protease family)
VVEEIIFRGLLQRGLLSALPPWLAIAVQGLLFGAAHVSPERGMGNIGLALVLGAVGVVFGAAAYLTRRLAPTMVAHAIVNAVAMAVVLSR